MADEFNPQGVDQTPRNNENPNSTADTGNAEPKNPFVGGDSVDAGNASDSSEQQAPVSSAALAADQQRLQSASSMRGHDDQVAATPLRFVHDRLVWVSSEQEVAVDRHPVRGADARGSRQDRLGLAD